MEDISNLYWRIEEEEEKRKYIQQKIADVLEEAANDILIAERPENAVGVIVWLLNELIRVLRDDEE